jgi:hypothetical protein
LEESLDVALILGILRSLIFFFVLLVHIIGQIIFFLFLLLDVGSVAERSQVIECEMQSFIIQEQISPEGIDFVQ